MFKNLLKVALRNLRRERGYTAINVLGLTLGIASALFILLYVVDELSFDRFHANADRIYRVATHIKEQDDEFTWPSTQIPFAEEIQEKYPNAEHAVRFIGVGRELFENGDLKFYEEDFHYTDPDIFAMFTYPFVAGNPETALRDPYTAVLTQETAHKYFGEEDALGKTLRKGKEVYTVTGVMENVPKNSHWRFDALLSRSSLPEEMGAWGGWGVPTYVQLREGVAPEAFLADMEQLNTEHVKPIFDEFGISMRYLLEPLPDIHLYSHLGNETEASGDITYVYIFASVALIMLVLACINYMNLATARSARRAREVGIRKAMGSTRRLLVAQFMSESVVLTLLATVLSLALVFLLLPFFNDLSGKALGYGFLGKPIVLGGLLLTIVVVALFSGSYPAFVLSRFDPVRTLKGNGTTDLSAGGRSLRKGLVVVQFAAAVVLLVSTWVVYDQLSFFRSKDLGYDKARLVVVEMADSTIRAHYPALRQQLVNLAGVRQVASASTKPGNSIGKNLISVETENEGRADRGVNLYEADWDYLDAVNIPVLQGRLFSRDVVSDTNGVLVNEAMVARMGWEEPLGKHFYIGPSENQREWHVIGVIKDYHQLSLYDAIEPLAIFFDDENNYYLHIKLDAGDPKPPLARIEQAWQQVNPGYPFHYTFLDQDFEAQFEADGKRGVIFGVFAGLTILIAALGLLALVSYTTEQRTREIGVRKVLGAEARDVVMLIARDFLLLIGVALVIALPLAGYFAYRWLESFVYRTDLHWYTFVAAAVVTLLLTMLTVGYHTLRAAQTDPVRALRAE
ncbi:putative ABC transport system permease protein [Catalinimonas alkaloidigena]|uniref:Putative ABC transport system permease protein n=1 Tax=Catalinimonas alkaloidigena TaxID=1075417 RepID=A0A1G9IUZ7_9BACT|nr:ABC transporter permease [Catalinimonas alkaloidigena]SDL28931.1 putative ABC transport system permease protein [Catalinimonas alkaloidigena]